jgi:hypothetical protein
MLNNQVGWDDNLPGERNPLGLHMQFTKIDADAFTSAKTVGHFVRYRVSVQGANKDQTYLLYMWKIGSQVQLAYGQVYVNARGLLMAHRPHPDQQDKDSVDSDDEIELAFQAAPGEPMRFLLTTSDAKLLVPGTVVPYPISSEDKGCRLEARLGMPDAQAVLLYVDGLAPSADVPFQAISEGEAHPASFHTNARGHAATVDLPYVEGKDAGVLKVSVATKECSVSVDIPWGNGSYHAF